MPKKDQCSDCVAFKNMTDDERDRIKEKHEFHLEMKQKARQLKYAYKRDAEISVGRIVTAVYDFQKVPSTPTVDVSVFYYSRKLSTYNFTVYDLAERLGNCYVWDQSIAGKGPDEVCSSHYMFMMDKMSNQTVEEFRFFSDNCGGQNRNRFVFGFYSYMSQKLDVDICHTFLEKGHTQNEGDSVHSAIEKQKKKSIVYVPSEWYTIIRNAKRTEKPL